MKKRHIAKVLFWESLISYVCSVVIGLVAGIIFFRNLMMLLYRLTGLEQKIRFLFLVWMSADHRIIWEHLSGNPHL